MKKHGPDGPSIPITRRGALGRLLAGTALGTLPLGGSAAGKLIAAENKTSSSRLPWAVPSLAYRILVEVPPVDIAGRSRDSRPASVHLDFSAQPFSALGLKRRINIDSIQVIGYDPESGKTVPGEPWPFSSTPGERASRFLDGSWPEEFPMFGNSQATRKFHRGGYFLNVTGEQKRGVLAWDHTQRGNRSSHYAIYFDVERPGELRHAARQGFLGDGLPRRAPETDSLSGVWYNRIAVDDWDGDGQNEILLGVGTGHILIYRNLSHNRNSPRFGGGDYLRDSMGQIIVAGTTAIPFVVDWNGDGIKDLLVGTEGPRLEWYQNIGTNKAPRLIYRGIIKTADGKDLVVPAKPCPESPHYTRDYAPTIDVVDWDGDGRRDLLLGGYITGYIWFYQNVGIAPDGTPKLAFRGPLEADGKPIDTVWGAAPCTVDLNGNGKPDLLSGAFGQRMGGGDAPSPFLYYYENIGTRTKPRLTQREVEYDGKPPKDILATPRPFGRNQRGLINLVISTMGKVYFAENTGTRKTPRWKIQLQKAEWGLDPLSATQLLDLNGDGYLDIVSSPLDAGDKKDAAHSTSPIISINKGLGPQGVFDSPRPLLPPGQEIHHPAPYGDPWAFTFLYDFNGDGARDLLWADGPGNVYLHRNRGTNSKPDFDTHGEKLKLVDGSAIKVGPPVVPIDKIKDFTVMQGSRASVTAADFNQDGKTDLALGDTYGKVYYFENRGINNSPVFAPGVLLGNIHERAIPLAYDWDHDGRMDIIGIAWSGQMVWFQNRGKGAQPQFAPAANLDLPSTVPYSPRLLIADWDGDGDDDYLLMSSYPWFCWLDGSWVKHGYAASRIIGIEVRD